MRGLASGCAAGVQSAHKLPVIPAVVAACFRCVRRSALERGLKFPSDAFKQGERGKAAEISSRNFRPSTILGLMYRYDLHGRRLWTITIEFSRRGCAASGHLVAEHLPPSISQSRGRFTLPQLSPRSPHRNPSFFFEIIDENRRTRRKRSLIVPFRARVLFNF